MTSFTLGINFINFDYDQKIEYINKHNQKDCIFSPQDDQRIVSTNNPLLAKNEFLMIDDVNKELQNNQLKSTHNS